METMRPLSEGELSALCSNLAKACSKQQRREEEQLFLHLADHWGKRAETGEGTDTLDALMPLVMEDLESGYPSAKADAKEDGDRASLRALVWGEKVTKLLKALLARRDSLDRSLNVYVCEICGFVTVASAPPAICPICKAPQFRFTEIKKEAV